MKVLAKALLAASFLLTSAAPNYANTETHSQDPLFLCKFLQYKPPFCKQAHP